MFAYNSNTPARAKSSIKFSILPIPQNLKSRKVVTTVATKKPRLELPKRSEKVKREANETSTKKITMYSPFPGSVK